MARDGGGVIALPAGANRLERGLHVWDDMAVEAEVAEFLYGLMRMLKPEVVVESGTGRGYAAFALATALHDNGHGHLTTFEPSEQLAAEAAARLTGLPATVQAGYACDAWEGDADLVFVDSWGAERPRDLAHWLPLQMPIVVHDAWEHARLLEGRGGVFLDTPRGLWLRT